MIDRHSDDENEPKIKFRNFINPDLEVRPKKQVLSWVLLHLKSIL